MKYMFIIGGSGSGKTTLADLLGTYKSEEFKVIKGSTTRAPREGETEKDYNFLTDEKYNVMLDNECFIGESEYLLAPIKYGYEKKLLDPDKYNIMILSIEGFINAVKKIKNDDEAILVHIIFDEKPFINREGRDANSEQRFNIAVLRPFVKNIDGKEYLFINDRKILYREYSTSTLSEYYESIKHS